MDATLRSLAFFLLVPAMACGGATLDEARDGGAGTTRSDDGGLSSGYPAGMIAASPNAAMTPGAALSFFTYDTTTGFVPSGALSGGSWVTGLCVHLAFDSARNLYVGCQGSPQQPTGHIVEFANGSTGDAQPIRSVTSPEIATGAMATMAVDPAGNIYVVSGNSTDDGGWATTLLVFGESSDTAPIRTIDLSARGLDDASGVALDAAGNVYVTTLLGPIEEFSAGASGDASPLRSFAGSDGYEGETGLAIDPSGRLYIATYDDPAPAVTPASLFVFGPGGAVERTVAGPATGLSLVTGVGIDGAGRMYVSDFPTMVLDAGGLHVFGAGASGNVPPEATLPGVGEYGFAVAP